MFLTAATIRRLIVELDPPLVDIIIPDDLVGPEREALEEKREGLKTRFIEGSCFDLELATIGELADVSEFNPCLGSEDRMIPPTIENEWYFANGRPDFRLLLSRKTYLFQSLETINLPPWLCAFVIPRTTVMRAGGAIPTGRISPGFHGKITQGWHSPDICTWIQKGFRFASVSFALFATDDEVKFRQQHVYPQTDMAVEVELYDGIWGKKTGDRMTTDGKTERGF